VIYGAKKSWVAYCKAEYKRIDNLPAEVQIPLRDALKKRRDKVREISTQVDAAWDVAWAAAKYDNKKPPTAELLQLVANLKLAIAP
jgi:cation transport regulator ChaB